MFIRRTLWWLWEEPLPAGDCGRRLWWLWEEPMVVVRGAYGGCGRSIYLLVIVGGDSGGCGRSLWWLWQKPLLSGGCGRRLWWFVGGASDGR